jgi:hypothetical protein
MFPTRLTEFLNTERSNETGTCRQRWPRGSLLRARRWSSTSIVLPCNADLFKLKCIAVVNSLLHKSLRNSQHYTRTTGTDPPLPSSMPITVHTHIMCYELNSTHRKYCSTMRVLRQLAAKHSCCIIWGFKCVYIRYFIMQNVLSTVVMNSDRKYWSRPGYSEPSSQSAYSSRIVSSYRKWAHNWTLFDELPYIRTSFVGGHFYEYSRQN